MQVLGRSAQLPSSNLEWLCLGVVLAVLFVSARLVGGSPAAVLGLSGAVVGYLFDAHIFIPFGLAMAAWIALVARGAGVSARSPKQVLVETSFLFGGFALYELCRHLVEGEWDEASANATAWLGHERKLGIDWEQPIQHWVVADHTRIVVVNSIYSWGFLSVVIAAVFWTFLVDDFHYRIFRNSLGISSAFAVVIMALHPTVPPRLLPGSGLVGTHAMLGGSHSFVNEFAAVPSLHVGWLALTGVILFWAVRSRWRWFWLVTPALVMQLTVMATGHHYFLDGVVGASIAVGPAFLMRRHALSAPVERERHVETVWPLNWINLAAREIADSPKVKVSFYGLGSLLVYLLARKAVDPGFTHYWGYQIFQIVVFMLVLLGVSVYFRDEGGLSWATHSIAVVTVWADSLGTAGHMYDRHASYDKITHYLGAMAAACLVCDILFALRRRGSITLEPHVVVAIGAGIAIIGSAGWEIYEYFGDIWFDTGRWAGKLDTTYDMISDTIGAISGAMLTGWINVNFASEFEVKRRQKIAPEQQRANFEQ